jgi:hypothetical protein
VARDKLPDLKDPAKMLDAVLSGKVQLSEFELRSLMDWIKVLSAEGKSKEQ